MIGKEFDSQIVLQDDPDLLVFIDRERGLGATFRGLCLPLRTIYLPHKTEIKGFFDPFPVKLKANEIVTGIVISTGKKLEEKALF